MPSGFGKDHTGIELAASNDQKWHMLGLVQERQRRLQMVRPSLEPTMLKPVARCMARAGQPNQLSGRINEAIALASATPRRPSPLSKSFHGRPFWAPCWPRCLAPPYRYPQVPEE